MNKSQTEFIHSYDQCPSSYLTSLCVYNVVVVCIVTRGKFRASVTRQTHFIQNTGLVLSVTQVLNKETGKCRLYRFGIYKGKFFWGGFRTSYGIKGKYLMLIK